MKQTPKKFFSVLSICMVVGLGNMAVLSMSGCGNAVGEESVPSAVSQTEEKSTVSQAESAQESSAPVILESNTTNTSKIEFSTDTSVVASKPYKTLNDCIESDTVKKQIANINNNDDENSVPIEYSVKVENKTQLVLERKLTEKLKYPDAFLKTLNTTISNRQSTFTDLVKALEDSVETEGITVVVRYHDVDNKTILEKEFNNSSVLESSQKESSAESDTDEESAEDNDDMADEETTEENDEE